MITVLAAVIFSQVAYGTNESSYKFGYQMGSLKGPQFAPGLNESREMGTYCTIYNGTIYSTELRAVTNSTACKDGSVVHPLLQENHFSIC